MANQAVKFHSVTEEEYKKISSPGAGSLYFISDNGEIRKGDKHISGTRVYTATDSTGTTAIDSLLITDNYGEASKVQMTDSTGSKLYTYTDDEGEHQVTTTTHKETVDDEEKDVANDPVMEDNTKFSAPKRGDMLVVTHTLATGKDEQTAYIYKTNGGTYEADGWQACDGNVDASKVILTSDITLAGSYTAVGNITKTSTTSTGTLSAQGVSVADLLQKIFTKELDNSSSTNPSFSLSGYSGSVEYGTALEAKEYKATWSDGSYGYGAYVSKGVTQTATGAAPGTWTIIAYDGKTAEDATISSDKKTATIKSDAVAAVTSTITLASFNVTNDLTNIKKAATNLKNEGTVVISKTTNSEQKKEVTCFHYYWYGSNTTAKDYTTIDTDGNATLAVNNNIRALGKTNTSLTSMSVVQGATQVVIALPKGKTLTKVTDGGAINAEIQGNFIPTTVKVGGGDSTSTSIGSNTYEYTVYVMTPSAPLDARTYTITIG